VLTKDNKDDVVSIISEKKKLKRGASWNFNRIWELRQFIKNRGNG
jgi:hypothetical protein